MGRGGVVHRKTNKHVWHLGKVVYLYDRRGQSVRVDAVDCGVNTHAHPLAVV